MFLIFKKNSTLVILFMGFSYVPRWSVLGSSNPLFQCRACIFWFLFLLQAKPFFLLSVFSPIFFITFLISYPPVVPVCNCNTNSYCDLCWYQWRGNPRTIFALSVGTSPRDFIPSVFARRSGRKDRSRKGPWSRYYALLNRSLVTVIVGFTLPGHYPCKTLFQPLAPPSILCLAFTLSDFSSPSILLGSRVHLQKSERANQRVRVKERKRARKIWTGVGKQVAVAHERPTSLWILINKTQPTRQTWMGLWKEIHTDIFLAVLDVLMDTWDTQCTQQRKSIP